MEPEEYQKMAAVEDDMWFYRALHRHIERRLERLLAPDGGEILDAGCGTGGLIKRLQPAHSDWSWQGVDISPQACTLAWDRAGCEVQEGSLTNLPFATGRFAAVVSADVIYHIEDDEQALLEMTRVLQPGGSLIVNVPAYPWLWSYHDRAVHAQRRYGRKELRDKLHRAGLEKVHLTYWNMFLLPLIMIRRKLLPAPAGGSDVQSYPAWLNTMLGGVMMMETALLASFGRLPLGCSLLAVAKKPA
ncbi:MAG: methyltransferase domain-containing protein [Cephaloticoccus sp.]|nr:methyltransferase domain-containing protein [Cephaloticoccus sp.]MCF7760720.1 methyltransferase domain-containing protein [Cephaloticoccus sp.]